MLLARFGMFSLCFFVGIVCSGQKFDGFVVTRDDSLIRGYMRLTNEGGKGKRLLITRDKNIKPRSFGLADLSYYAYKKDTFAILDNFYPFEGNDYAATNIEAKIVIGRGKLKLYHGLLPGYFDGYAIPIIVPVPTGVVVAYRNPDYHTYIIKNREGQLYGVKKEKKNFLLSLEPVIGDNKMLMERIARNELKFRDMAEIIRIYNAQ